MEEEGNPLQDKKKENLQDKADLWIEKAEAFIDEKAEQIHKSQTYKKTGQSADKITRKLFREAGRWWGKNGK